MDIVQSFVPQIVQQKNRPVKESALFTSDKTVSQSLKRINNKSLI